MTKATTVYLDPRLLKVIKMKAVEMNSSVSRLVNDAIRLTLREDAADFRAIKDREHEPARSFEDVVKDLKKDGLI